MAELAMESQGIAIKLSEEELAVIQMALMRGMSSSNAYFREMCEKLLKKFLDNMSNG
ncbi:MAG: hypothetical protein QXF52_00760 [Thermoproteota archaeon]